MVQLLLVYPSVVKVRMDLHCSTGRQKGDPTILSSGYLSVLKVETSSDYSSTEVVPQSSPVHLSSLLRVDERDRSLVTEVGRRVPVSRRFIVIEVSDDN